MRLLTDDEVRRGGTRELFYGSDPMEMEDPQTIVPRASSVAAPGGDDVFREREESLISSFNQAQSSGVAPERAREDLRLARGMDVPFFVVNQSDRIRNSALLAEHREAYRPAFAKIARERPATAKFLSDPGNMLLAQNDVERLAEAEGLIDIAKRAHHRGVVETELSQLMGKKAIYGMTDEHVGGRIRELRAELDSLKDGPREGFASWVWSAVNTLPQMERQWLAGGGWGAALGAAAGAASATKYGALIPFPEEVVTVPLAMYYGGRRGYVAGAMKTAFEIETGAAYDEFLAVPGVSDEAARVAAVSVGIINSGIEALEAATLVSGFPGGKAALKKLVGRAAMKEALTDPTVAKALGAFAKRYAKGLTFETAQEMAQEVVNILGGRALKAYVGAEQESFAADAARVAAVGVESFKGYSLISAVGPTTSLARDARRVRHGRSAYRVLTESARAADSLAASDMGPEAAREFTKEVMAGSSAEKVFIPGRTLAELHQSGHIQNYEEFVEETLGVPTEAAYEASELGSYLEVDTDALVFAPEPLRNELLREAKFSPEDLSENERTVVVQELQARREADLQAALIEADELRREDKQGALVRETIAAQMKIAAADYDKANAAQHKEGNGLAAEFAGGDVERLADTAGRVMEAVSKVSSREWTLAGRKMGPREWLAEQGLSIAFGEAKGGLQQSVWHGSPYRFDKFSLEHIGSGEGAQAYGWGLYFADDKEVSGWYRKQLTHNYGNVEYEGRTARRWHDYFKIRALGNDNEKDVDMCYDCMSLLEALEAGHDPKGIVADAKEMEFSPEAIEWFDKTIAQNKDRPGALYKVDIPDDGNYLLWDEKVSEDQAQVLLEALSESDDFDGPVSNWVRKERMNDSSVTDYISEEDIADEYYPPDVLREHVETYTDFYEASGEYVYNQLADIFGSPKAASLWLKEHGVPGIKYLDGNSRSIGEGNYNYVIFDDQDARIQETFYQPMNPDVDPDSFVHVVDLSGSYDGTSYSKVQELKNKIRGMVPLAITTADNKMLVEVLNRNTEHLAHSSAPLDISLNIPALRKAAFDSLSDVIANAVLIESIKNEKITKIDPSWTKSKRRSINRKNTISFYHRLYVPITVDGKDYKTIRLVAEERADGNISVNPKTVELYDVIPEDKSARLSTAPANDSGKLIDLPGISRITIREMLSNVNDFYGDQYLQNARGSITFPSLEGQPLRITLGKKADRSTFVHELGHLYLWHLKRLSATSAAMNSGSWSGPEARWNTDLKVVSRWWDERAEDIARQAAFFVKDEAARSGLSAVAFREWLTSGMEKDSAAGRACDRAAQEYFARGFERYLAEGKAPSKELTGVFRRFKRWLCEIYKSLTELDVELSEDIREVFDRMVATDEAVERLRAERELDLVMASVPEGDEETMGPLPDFGDDPFEAAKESLLSGLVAKLTPERRKAMTERAEEVRPQVLSEVLAEPGFKALLLLEEVPEMRLSPEAVLDEFGETVLGAMPEGSLAEDGVTDLTIAARSLEFDTPKEMIDAMAGRRSLKQEVDARVRLMVAAEFADEAADPAAMDAAASAALYDNEEQGERLAAEAEADFDAALDAAAEAEEEEARFRAIFEADDAAKREREEPGSRTNVLAWIRANGYLSYRMVEAAIGGEQARELRDKLGPGMFRTRSNMGLDTAAQALSSSGVPIASDEALFKLLMSDPAPESPLDLAKAEARREVMGEYRERYAAFRQKAEAGAAADREKLTALEAKMKERYDNLTVSLKDKYKAMGDRQRAVFAEKQKRERVNRAVDRYLKTLAKQVEGRLDKRSLRGGAKIAAENAVSAMSIQRLYDVSGWVRVEKDYRLGAENALRNFDEKLFRHCKSKELHAHEMIKAIYRARKNAEFMRSRLKEYQGRGGKRTFGMSPNFLKQMDALLSRFDLERRTKAAKAELAPKDMRADVKTLDEFVTEQAEEGVPLLIPDWIVKSNESWKYEALRMHEFEEVYKAVQNIMQTGRDEKKTIARENNLELASIDAQVLTRSQGYFGKDKIDGDTNIVVAKEDPKLTADFIKDLDTAEAMCRALDGYQDFGPMQDFVFRPIREAVSREYAELNRVFGAFRDLKLRVYGKDFKADMKKRDIGVREYKRETEAETGRVYYVPTKKMSLFTRENLICAALNMGNADNIARLKDGWGWTDEDVARIADQLTEADWQYVQGVWDLLETMWPQVRKVHELMTGTTIEKVEARPLSTKYGELRGGYYPIVTDSRYSESAAAQNERQEVMASAPLDHAQRFAKSGHRKERAENVLGRPPILTFGVLDNHIANVIHDYELSAVVRDVRKILRRDVVRSVIKSVLGERGLRNFNGWLNDIAANTKNNGVVKGPGDRLVQGIKSNTAMFALGGNLGGALMQPLGYFSLAHRIGFVNTALAIMNGLAFSHEVYGFAYEHSEFMREQMTDGNSEVRKLRQNWTTNDHGISRAADMMLSIYPLLQNMCNVPGWVQCYKVGLNKYGTEAKAVAYADSVIRQTQSASTIADLNTFERSGTIGQMFTMFYSWFRVMYQMQNEAVMKVRYEHGLWNKTRDLASYAAYVLVAQSVVEALLRGSGPDTEDDDPMWAWARWTAGRMVLGPLSTVPVARELGNFIDTDFKFGVKMSPIQSTFDGVGRAIRIAYKQAGNLASGEEVDWGAVGDAGATLAGYRYGVPNRKMIQAAKAFWSYFDEEEAIPWLYLLMGGGWKPKD